MTSTQPVAPEVADLVRRIETVIYPFLDDGEQTEESLAERFLTDPGGLLGYFDLTTDDALAREAIAAIESQVTR